MDFYGVKFGKEEARDIKEREKMESVTFFMAIQV